MQELRRRPYLWLLVFGLVVASLATGVLLPNPGWWHVGYPLDASVEGWPLDHPAPARELPFLLFAWSGLAIFSSVRGGWRLFWGLLVACTVANVPFAVLLFDQSVYDSLFGPGRSLTILSLTYTVSGYVVFALVVAFGLLYAYVAIRWLGWLVLRVPPVGRRWNRRSFTWREFRTDSDVLGIEQRWAQANGVKLVWSDESSRWYEKPLESSDGAAFFSLVLRIEQSADRVRLSAGIFHDWRMRLMSFGILPAVMQLASGGVVGVFGRRRGRRLVNELLGQLEQPPIE